MGVGYNLRKIHRDQLNRPQLHHSSHKKSHATFSGSRYVLVDSNVSVMHTVIFSLMTRRHTAEDGWSPLLQLALHLHYDLDLWVLCLYLCGPCTKIILIPFDTNRVPSPALPFNKLYLRAFFVSVSSSLWIPFLHPWKPDSLLLSSIFSSDKSQCRDKCELQQPTLTCDNDGDVREAKTRIVSFSKSKLNIRNHQHTRPQPQRSGYEEDLNAEPRTSRSSSSSTKSFNILLLLQVRTHKGTC